MPTIAGNYRTIRRGLLLIALAALCTLAQAAPQLSVIQPDREDPLAGGQLRLVFNLQDEGTPISGEYLYLTSTFGVLSAQDLMTGSTGSAFLEITSQSPGAGTVTAHTRSGDSVSHNFVFTPPLTAQLFVTPVLPALEPGQTTDLLIRVLDASLTPVSSGYVILAVVQPQDGTLSKSTVTLDRNGEGITTFTASPDAKVRNTTGIRAALDGSPGVSALPLVSIVSLNSGLLEFLRPAAGTEVEINKSQDVEVKYSISGRPVRNWTIDVSTSQGTVSDSQPKTDFAGIARFSVQSATAGNAQLEATVGGLNDTLDIKFVDPGTVVNRYDGRKSAQVIPSFVDLDIASDRIGFLATDQATFADVHAMASQAGLSLDTLLNERIFVLKASSDLSRNTLWMKARTLSWRHPDKVKTAGLVAKLSGSTQSLLISEFIIARVKPGFGLTPAFLTFLKTLPYSFSSVQQADFGANQFILTLDDATADDPLDVSIELAAQSEILYAHPNFIWVLDKRTSHVACAATDPWCDLLYFKQWHLENKGTWALEDADADVREAWNFTHGGPSTTIAVLDSGFDISHPDLIPNLWGAAGNHGIDLVDNDASSLMNGSTSPGHLSHGTSAAGIAAARGGNSIGVTGSCPLCKLLPIRFDPSSVGTAMAFAAAVTNGASVISNSWGWFGIDSTVSTAIDTAVNAGAVVLFAMSNDAVDNCGSPADISAHEKVIAVSGITDEDRRSSQPWQGLGYGICMDVQAPTKGGVRGISTTSVVHLGAGTAWTYTIDFSGTSAATPLVAGVAGLMRHITPGLTPLQVQMILQDTADKVEPDSGTYNQETGFSHPTGLPTHGYGRINAFEALQLVAPTGKNGRDNQDLLLRDHALDWGNTEQTSDTRFSSPRGTESVENSVDIKIDSIPLQNFNTANALASYQALVAEQPVPGVRSVIYVRVRNRGQDDVAEAKLKLHWATYANALPDLPADFWKVFPADSTDTSNWHPLSVQTITDLAYSGASAAGCPGRVTPPCLGAAGLLSDQAEILIFDAPPIPWNSGGDEHLAWLAVVDSKDDPVQANLNPAPIALSVFSVMSNVVWDNNIAIWISGVEDSTCPGWLLGLLVFLLLLAVILLLYIVYLLAVGSPPSSSLVLAFILLLFLLAIVATYFSSTEGCCEWVGGWFAY
jgi:subtilisin family serine protease